MKIKNDFITNSSSTSFVVVIPSNLDIDSYLTILEQAEIATNLLNDDILNSFMDNQIFSKIKKEDRVSFLLQQFKLKMKSICDGEIQILHQYNNGIADLEYLMILEFCRQLNLIAISYGSDDMDGKINFLTDRVFKRSWKTVQETATKFVEKNK